MNNKAQECSENLETKEERRENSTETEIENMEEQEEVIASEDQEYDEEDNSEYAEKKEQENPEYKKREIVRDMFVDYYKANKEYGIQNDKAVKDQEEKQKAEGTYQKKKAFTKNEKIYMTVIVIGLICLFVKYVIL